MDRSSMRVVQTNDHETRQAFKARLASKLETTEQNQEPVAAQDPFQIGATVWHPNLGEATILTVGHDLVLKFSHGEIVFNQEQIKPYLSFTAPKAETPIKDEATFGDTIDKRYPVRPDAVYRPFVEQPVKETVVPEVAFVPEKEPKRDEWQGAFFGEEIDRSYPDRSGTAYRPVVEQPIRDFEAIPEVTFVPKSDPKRDTWDGAFVGETIDRTPPIRPDQALREPQNTGKMVSPDFKDVEKPSFAAGDIVWHPQLGKCLVEELNKKEIVLSAADGQKVSLVLSQVQSKLHLLSGEAPEVVPVKPLVREKSRNLQARNELKKISVDLPNQFKDWTKQSQFHFLTNNQHLTTDDANRVFTAIDRGNDATVNVNWFEPEPLPVPEVREVVVYKTINGSELVGRRVWHPDFGECVVASVDHDEIVLNTKVGNIPFVSHLILPILVPLADGASVDHKIRYDLGYLKSD